MMRLICAILVVALSGCCNCDPVDRPKVSAQDAAYLAMYDFQQADYIAGSSPARKFELLVVQWTAYHPTAIALTTDLFAPHFLELRQPMLAYLDRPDPDPAVLGAIMGVIWRVAHRREQDVRGDEELRSRFIAALDRVDLGDPEMGTISVFLPSVWPDAEVPGLVDDAGSDG